MLCQIEYWHTPPSLPTQRFQRADSTLPTGLPTTLNEPAHNPQRACSRGVVSRPVGSVELIENKEWALCPVLDVQTQVYTNGDSSAISSSTFQKVECAQLVKEDHADGHRSYIAKREGQKTEIAHTEHAIVAEFIVVEFSVEHPTRKDTEKSSKSSKMLRSRKVRLLRGPKDKEHNTPNAIIVDVTSVAAFFRDQPNSSETYAVATSWRDMALVSAATNKRK